MEVPRCHCSPLARENGDGHGVAHAGRLSMPPAASVGCATGPRPRAASAARGRPCRHPVEGAGNTRGPKWPSARWVFEHSRQPRKHAPELSGITGIPLRIGWNRSGSFGIGQGCKGRHHAEAPISGCFVIVHPGHYPSEVGVLANGPIQSRQALGCPVSAGT